MIGGLLIHYAHKSAAPEFRVANFVESEPRLTWTSLFLSDHPEAQIYLVGGTVRDVLLGSSPEDVDLVVRGVPAKTIERWLSRQGAVRFVGERFGTFKFTPHGCRDMQPIDIALPRTEQIADEHRSGRKDQVVETDFRLSIKEDLSRRDYTINAIAFDIQSRELIDPHNGMQDLGHQLIRTVLSPEARFYEDATRILRGLRFASQLRFGIEQETWSAICNNLDVLNNKVVTDDGTFKYVIPRDAIGKEFLLGFISHPVHTLNLWDEAGAIELFIPWLHEQKTITLDDNSNAFEKTKDLLHMLHRPSFLARHKLDKIHPNALIAALSVFSDEHEHALHLCRQLYLHQFPTNHWARIDCDVVAWLLDNRHILETEDPAGMRPSAFEKMFCTQKGQQLLAFIHAIELVKGAHSATSERIHNAKRLYDHYCSQCYPKLVSGKDLIELGLEPGIHFRDLLDKVRDLQLVNKIQTRPQAQEYIKTQI
ncbi:CCA tRNA nucleotidyltransferase [Candidatus Uhrbacteria bacterium]|jgi:tRNA nucleotidyltransferase/poly(A) polymerase|nr:CCA tRNA nucleotidyltransferase [Candidatus Uhrbacteria bacterium]MBT7716861.1 CCA tRNA nucleotidyltransferase [Candidatus Uhrbacteria bacterium]